MPLLTTQELARELNVCVSHVKGLVRRREIPSQKMGRARRFVLEDVLAQCHVEAKLLVPSVEAKAERDARQIIAGQVVRRLDLQRKRKVG